MSVVVSTFYKFAHVDEPARLKTSLEELCREQETKGTILVAHEGINATISGSHSAIAAVLGWLKRDPRFSDLVSKESQASAHPFRRMKVKLKREIVTFGVPEADPARLTGTYVKPSDWNALIADPEVIVLDTRNEYEVAAGTFGNAVDPKTRSFREFPQFVECHYDPARHKKIAMFCTGGIRCEKASAYMLHKGFPEVYHLEGGILRYLETVPANESLFRGECFVFDERVALEHGVVEGSHVMCRTCGWPVKRKSRNTANAQIEEFCPRCSAGKAGEISK